MADAPDDQLSRRWRLLQMIEHPHCVTVDDAARDLKCTLCTIWLDPDVLQQVAFPLYTESAAGGTPGVWRVTEEFKRTLPATFKTRTTTAPQ